MDYINNGGAAIVGRQTLELYLQAGSSNPTPILPSPETTNRHVIAADRVEATFAHGLQTAAIVPAFTPSWYTAVMPTWLTTTSLRVAFSVPAPTKNATLDFVVSRGTREAVTAEATSKAITHSLGSATANIFISTSWNTEVWRTAKTSTILTLGFSIPAASGSYIYWSRHNEDDDITGTGDVTENATSHTITHNANRANLPLFLLPNWNTTVRFADKSHPNRTVVSFGTPAPADAELDWRVKYTT